MNTLVIQGTKYMAIFGGTDSNAVWLFDFGSHQFKHVGIDMNVLHQHIYIQAIQMNRLSPAVAFIYG